MVSADEAVDEHFAGRCQVYATSRGYRGKTAIIRDWDLANGLVLADWAQVIIVARHEYLARGWRPWSGSDIEAALRPDGKPPRHLRLVSTTEREVTTMARRVAPQTAEGLVEEAARQLGFGASADPSRHRPSR
jgi:hypothetical protein